MANREQRRHPEKVVPLEAGVDLSAKTGQRWKCPECGDEPDNVTPETAGRPVPPGIPRAYGINVNNHVTYHCVPCRARMERRLFPVLMPIEMFNQTKQDGN